VHVSEHGGNHDETVDQVALPGAARLAADHAIDVLPEDAPGASVAQERLRSLLRAGQLVASHVDLPVVLRHITDAARDLVNARYAALGVLGPNGTVQEFVHSGVDENDAARIGHPPRGQGVLGLLVTDPRPIRVADLADHPSAAGFPPGHPPMRSFLGVPIVVRGRAFGNLYLADKQDADEFSAEDEQILLSLAGFAAIAIDNAHLYAEARRRAAWQQAGTEITAALLAGTDTDDVLHLIADRAHTVAHADLAAVVLPTDEPHTLTVHAAVGDDTAHLPGQRLPAEDSPWAQVLADARPRLSDDLSENPRGGTPAATFTANLGPTMIAPLVAPGRSATGVLLVANRPGRRGFHDSDLDMLTAFAAQAALAQQLARHRADTEQLHLLDERDRIARDLHDHVIQEVFATGLSLSTIASTSPADQRSRLLTTVGKLDQVIRDIRGAIFDLNSASPSEGETPPGLRRTLTELVRNTTDGLGFTPVLRLDGPLDTLVPDAVATDLLAVVREALSNTARHAHATTAAVQVTATPTRLTACVEDDGRGIGDTTRRSGLANLRARAAKHGGMLTIDSSSTRGTTLTWTAALPACPRGSGRVDHGR
jgi:signal transduction histidine kinase